jgi:hypothetical protein
MRVLLTIALAFFLVESPSQRLATVEYNALLAVLETLGESKTPTVTLFWSVFDCFFQQVAIHQYVLPLAHWKVALKLDWRVPVRCWECPLSQRASCQLALDSVPQFADRCTTVWFDCISDRPIVKSQVAVSSSLFATGESQQRVQEPDEEFDRGHNSVTTCIIQFIDDTVRLAGDDLRL